MKSLCQNGTADQEKNKGRFRKSIEKKKEESAFEGCVRLFCIGSNCAICVVHAQF